MNGDVEQCRFDAMKATKREKKIDTRQEITIHSTAFIPIHCMAYTAQAHRLHIMCGCESIYVVDKMAYNTCDQELN